MKINAELILKCRKEKSWSQDELATASGLSIRTIQRVESEALASLQTKKALASALDIDIHDLDFDDNLLSVCSVCRSREIYQYKEYFQYSGAGEELLPKVGKGLLGIAKICPFVCVNCGHIRLMASSEVREKIETSEHWTRCESA